MIETYAAAISDTYPIGMAFVVWGITVIVFAISLIEVFCDYKGWPTVGYQIGEWSERNPWLAYVYIFASFLLLAHFVLNPLPK